MQLLAELLFFKAYEPTAVFAPLVTLYAPALSPINVFSPVPTVDVAFPAPLPKEVFVIAPLLPLPIDKPLINPSAFYVSLSLPLRLGNLIAFHERLFVPVIILQINNAASCGYIVTMVLFPLEFTVKFAELESIIQNQ